MTDRTGILPNSPLVYTLASVRFAQWPLLAKKIDEIHDKMRDVTPLINRIQVQVGGQPMVQSEGSTPAAWMLTSKDRSFGVQFAPDQLLVFSSNYRRYKDFEDIVSKALNELLTHMRFVDVVNAGVRYVDRIRVREGESFEQYVASNLLPPKIPSLDRVGGEVVGMYRSGLAELRVRCLTQPGALNVPEDLVGVLAMAVEAGRPLKLDVLTGNEFLLDVDAIKNFQEPNRMESEAILELLDSLHVQANAFFRNESVCTKYAFEVWKGAA